MRKLDVYTYFNDGGNAVCANVFLYWAVGNDIDKKWFPYVHQDTALISGNPSQYNLRGDGGGHWECELTRL